MVGAGDPDLAGDGPDGAGMVAGDDLDLDPSAANQATVSAASPRTRSPITTMARGTSAGGWRRRCGGWAEVGQEQDPPALDGDPLGLAQQLVPPDRWGDHPGGSQTPVAIRRQQHLGGAEQEAAAGGEAGPAPLAGRGEQDGPLRPPAAGGGERLADGPQGGVGVGVGGGQGAEGGAGLLLPRRSVRGASSCTARSPAW